MGAEHSPETVWQAQELYCVERLPFAKVAEALGIADSTVRRWADTQGWREQREEIARAETEIRVNKVLARAKTVKSLLDKPAAHMAFAVTALESLAIKEAEIARNTALTARSNQDEISPAAFNTPAEVIAALKKAVEQRLSLLLSRPDTVDLKSVQEVAKISEFLQQMEAKQPAPAETEAAGMSANLVERIHAAMRGEL